jgi:hypothetical protein
MGSVPNFFFQKYMCGPEGYRCHPERSEGSRFLLALPVSLAWAGKQPRSAQ